jgi:hypothetical protein
MEIKHYQEIPDHVFIHGDAVQLKEGTESAVKIAQWLTEHGIVAYATPQAGMLSANLMIPEGMNSFYQTGGIVLPSDWVLIENVNGGINEGVRAVILPDWDFNRRFRGPDDDRKGYRIPRGYDLSLRFEYGRR